MEKYGNSTLRTRDKGWDLLCRSVHQDLPLCFLLHTYPGAAKGASRDGFSYTLISVFNKIEPSLFS